MFSFISLFGRVTSTRNAQTLEKYSRDSSVFKILPKEIYYPRTTADVVTVVRTVSSRKKYDTNASVTVRAGGTCMSGGPLNSDVIVDMTTYMNKVSIDPKSMTAQVEMGTYFRDVEDAALKHGLMFAPYPSSRRICGIGGMIGNNASGEKSIRYGATSDNVLEMEVVLADGTVTVLHKKHIGDVTEERERTILALASRHGEGLAACMGEVKKAASGYRLDKVLREEEYNPIPLFVGAQGTLGIITRATLKLIPIPKHLSLIVISAKKLEDIPVIVKEIFKHNPEAIETFDSNTWNKAREHLKEHAEVAAQYFDEKSELFILAEFGEQTKEATEKMADACHKKLEKAGYIVRTVAAEKDVASIWEVRRNSFLLMRDHNPEGYKAVPCIEDVIVPVSNLAVFIDGLHKILKKRNIQYGFHGHIGDGSLRIVPVFKVDSPTFFEDVHGLMEETFALVKKLKGNMSADHSDGIIRSPYLRSFYGDTLYHVFEKIKNIFDPLSIMNPGKKVGVSRADIERYFEV
jgi:FAD/FMN-containing dehydrogenase